MAFSADNSLSSMGSPPSKLRANAKAWSFSPTTSPATSPKSQRSSYNPYMEMERSTSTRSAASSASSTSTYNPYLNYNPYIQGSDSSGYSSDGSDSSVSSTWGYPAADGSINIIPTQRNEADGYNRFKTPSGQVCHTASGQKIELFAGTHTGAGKDACGSSVMFE